MEKVRSYILNATLRISHMPSHILPTYSVYSDTKRSLTDYIGDESQRFLRSNVAQLLVLTIDNVIGLNGGLKQLLALSTNLKLSSSKVQLL